MVQAGERADGVYCFSLIFSCHRVETHLCQPLLSKSLLTRPGLNPGKSISLKEVFPNSHEVLVCRGGDWSESNMNLEFSSLALYSGALL